MPENSFKQSEIEKVQSLYNRGTIAADNGKYDIAIRLFDEFLCSKPKPQMAILAYWNLALSILGKFDFQKRDGTNASNQEMKWCLRMLICAEQVIEIYTTNSKDLTEIDQLAATFKQAESFHKSFVYYGSVSKDDRGNLASRNWSNVVNEHVEPLNCIAREEELYFQNIIKEIENELSVATNESDNEVENGQKVDKTQIIIDELKKYEKKYIDSQGNEILVGGLNSVLYPEKNKELAEKFNYKKHKEFAIDDLSVLEEAKKYLEDDRAVIISIWTEDEKKIEMWLEREKNEYGSSKPKGGCFIATAVYGSYDCPQVIVLRKFRDEYLLSSRFGRIFVGLYYRYSPIFAKMIHENDTIRLFLRYRLFDSFINLINKKTKK